MIETIVLIAFVLVMALNVWALVRHWLLMRALTIALNGLIQTQHEFFALVERERLGGKASVAERVERMERVPRDQPPLAPRP